MNIEQYRHPILIPWTLWFFVAYLSNNSPRTDFFSRLVTFKKDQTRLCCYGFWIDAREYFDGAGNFLAVRL